MLRATAALLIPAVVRNSGFVGLLSLHPMEIVQILIYIAVVLNIAFIIFIIIKYYSKGKK